MKNTDSSVQSDKGKLSTLRGRIGAAVAGLLALNAAGTIWLIFAGGGSISVGSRIGAAALFVLAVIFGILAVRFVLQEAARGVSQLSSVFQNLQGAEADLSCTMQNLDDPDLQHISDRKSVV
jgi:methyl-accepting chemotaxis protein